MLVIRSDRGKRIMDEICAVVAEMIGRERQLLDKRNRIAGNITLHNFWMAGIGFLVLLLVLSASAVIITRTLRLAGRSTRTKDSGRKWPGITIRYMYALAIVALAMLVRRWLVSFFGPIPHSSLRFSPC